MRARGVAVLVLAALALSACGSVRIGTAGPASMQAGTFAKVGRPAAEALAEDGVSAVAGLYAPAKTRVVFHQGAESEFGEEVEQRLRIRGYSVDVGYERQDERDEDTVYVRFVLDDAAGLVRLTMVCWTGEDKEYTVLNRGYVVKKGTVVPAGSWTKKG